MADKTTTESWLNIQELSVSDKFLIIQLLKTEDYGIGLILQLLSRIKLDTIKGCWLIFPDWSAYHQIENKPAHRVSYELFRGPIIKDEICHNCDRPGCVNPWHLFQGSHSNNMQDARNKGKVFTPSLKTRQDELVYRLENNLITAEELSEMKAEEFTKSLLRTLKR